MSARNAPASRVRLTAARIVRNRPVCDEHCALELAVDRFPPSHPGQFLQVLCHPLDPLEPRAFTRPEDGFPQPGSTFSGDAPLLRRPFSIADCVRRPDGSTQLTLISRTVGRGTGWLERATPGQALNIIGPLGRGFRVPQGDTLMVLAGGGVGVPPLLYLARRLHEERRQRVIAIFGARSANLLPLRITARPDPAGNPERCVELPGGAPYPAIIATDDGSLGVRGHVAGALRRLHEQVRAASAVLVCACGPEPMLRAVGRVTRELRVGCQLCIERMMGCGIGTCLSCVVRVRDESPAGWRWALCCVEGPVFDRDDLIDPRPAAPPGQ